MDYDCLIEHGDDEGVPLRALYIIDTQSTIRHITLNDLPVGPSAGRANPPLL